MLSEALIDRPLPETGHAADLRRAAALLRSFTTTPDVRLFADVLEERAHQVEKGRDRAHDDARTSADWTDCLVDCVGLAMHVDGPGQEREFRRRLVKIAAAALAGVAAMDRKAARR